MKIVAAADHHICESLRFDECQAVHQRIVEIVREERPDMFVSAGDVYHRASSPVERLFAAEVFSQIAEVCPVRIVKGNHDRSKDLLLLSKLQTKHPIAVVEDISMVTINGVLFSFLAWPNKRSLLQGAMGQQEADRTALGAYRDLLTSIGSSVTGRSVVVAHALVDGASTGKGQPLVGLPLSIPASDFALSKADVVLLGHIHKAQCFGNLRHGNVYYCGSPFRTEYGQMEDKSVLVVDILEHGDLIVRRESTGARPMLDVEATYNTEMASLYVPHALNESFCFRADIRLRYSVAVEHRSRAAECAKGIRRMMLQAGAATVIIDDEILVTSSSRVPELLESQGVSEQLGHYWASRPADENTERSRSLAMELLQPLIEEFDLDNRGGRSIGTYRRVAAHGILPFDDVELDLSAIDGTLVAVRGPNGVGKTTLLELLPGAAYRKTATRGALVEMATKRDSWVEVDAMREDGEVTRIRISIDCESGRSESLVTPQAFEGTSVRDHDKWVARAFPPRELTYSSMFAPQGSGGWLRMESGERKTVILRAMGLDKLEKAAEKCRKRAAFIDQELQEKRAKVGAVALTVDLESIATRLKESTARLKKLQADTKESEDRLYNTRFAHEKWAARHRSYYESCAKLEVLKRSQSLAESRIKAVRDKLATERLALAAADDSRIDLDAFRKKAEEAGNLSRQMENRVIAAEHAIAQKEQARQTAQRELQSAAMRLRRANEAEVLSELDEIDGALDKISEVEAAIAQARKDFCAARDSRDSLNQKLSGLSVDSVANAALPMILRLDETATELPEARLIAKAAMNADRAAAALRRSLPESIAQAQSTMDAISNNGQKLKGELARLKLLHASRDRLDRALFELSEARTAHDAASKAAASLAGTDDALVEVARLRDLLGEANKAYSIARSRLKEAEGKEAERIQALSRAGAIAAIEEEVSRAVQHEQEISKQISAYELEEPPGDEPPLYADEASCAQTREQLAKETATNKHLEEEFAKAKDHVDSVKSLVDHIARSEEQRDALALLGSGLGSSGLQSAIVDAVGPELTATVNNLLHSCWGSRWSVEVKVAPVGSGREDCQLLVHDRTSGRVFDARRLSGGQSVVVGEAVSMALAIMGARRTGQRLLVRDEPSGALDRDNVQSYARMLREGAAMVGADHVLIVTHQQELIDVADQVITVSESGVTVEGGE